ncbi:Holliday junction resolvase Hjc [Halobaculum sp. EA56]|uniref:Holliday junction resolvase Hjc n=1 Tax=Halobaculum sp. EA56 TaxID=3421648 RepID=UPI003EBE2DB9
MPGNPKGDRRERELVNRLADAGFAPMRAPASGSSTERELPDVICGNGEYGYAIEAKSSAGDPIYIDSEEVTDLQYFAEMLGLSARLAVRFDREPWWFLAPADCHRTDSGTYRIKLPAARSKGLRVDDLTGESKQARLGELDSID